MVTRSQRKASCSTPEPPPQEKRGRQRWRGRWGVRWARQRKTSGDADECQDRQRDGGHWQGRVVPDRWGSGTPALPVWTRPFDQPWASEDRVVTASRARTFPLDWPAVQQRSVRTAADRWSTLEDRPQSRRDNTTETTSDTSTCLGTHLRILRIWRRAAKQSETVFDTCTLMEASRVEVDPQIPNGVGGKNPVSTDLDWMVGNLMLPATCRTPENRCLTGVEL